MGCRNHGLSEYRLVTGYLCRPTLTCSIMWQKALNIVAVLYLIPFNANVTHINFIIVVLLCTNILYCSTGMLHTVPFSMYSM